MTTYAVAHLREVRMGPEIIAYIQAIDSTLAPFKGRFIIHGGEKEELEGHFTDDLIVLAFPDRHSARSWYQSEAYQAILPKRLSSSDGDVFFIDGVDESHRATDILPREMASAHPTAQTGSQEVELSAICFRTAATMASGLSSCTRWPAC